MATPQTLKDQQKRYMNLDGSPVHTHGLKRVLLTPEGKAGLLASTFNICAAASAQAQPGGADMVSTALFCAGATALFAGMSAFFGRRFMYTMFSDPHNTVIDTAPDAGTPPTSPDNWINAVAFAIAGGLVSLGHTALNGGAAVASLSATANSLFNGAPLAIPSVGENMAFCQTIALAAGMAYRFFKVTKKDWVITDIPKKIEQEEEQKVLTPAPQLTT